MIDTCFLIKRNVTLEERKKAVDTVVKVRNEFDLNIGILYDTRGPEFRNDDVENGELDLEEGKEIKIFKDHVLGNKDGFSVNYPEALDDLEVGSIILLENGLMKIEVISKEQDGITCKVINGGVLGNKKSLSVPGVHLDIPFISDDDYNDIVYACKHDGNFLALSFVSTKEDVLEVRKILKDYNREDLKLIAKIESTTGVENLESILEVSDGVMVARGDLGVEVPMEELPITQMNIIRKCRENGKIAIVATEMLESMKKNMRPTRAEVSDIANAVLSGTDAVMLSGETTTGKYPVEAVRYMASICETNEKYFDYEEKINAHYAKDIPSTVAASIDAATNTLDVKAIVAATLSGYTARKISNLRPNSLILAACPNEGVAYSLALNFGVYPTIIPIEKTTDKLLDDCIDKAKETFNLNKGDIVILSGGIPLEKKVSVTNFMKIEEIK